MAESEVAVAVIYNDRNQRYDEVVLLAMTEVTPAMLSLMKGWILRGGGVMRLDTT
jgi:hypothetical protein